ncbi:acyl-CoA synthetase (AMP-forming)/AMP-acid ligase II [Kitasatospora sp. SolWspMP-SS2h]|uniref:long-chain fatty acid--CoA ligase n=1 Tax=Kitasatospora sp. SolWspMP-SS2h TaxID=1305729 RepID=UPI000DBFB982|nr:long-chain fatty acid--CoA ligase [Kitasatospora sp. SolWspMP-SS2h]RAJ46270.1 acyl-CoA synthetase (AMP-forming)/AMP-acid ligase II [Kitasatospora sp. SolWspMP-SS2h]
MTYETAEPHDPHDLPDGTGGPGGPGGPGRTELLDRLDELGDRPAVVHGDERYGYAELADEVRLRLKELDAAGVRPHQAVILNGDFSFRSIAALLALHLHRAVAVPVVTLTEATLATVTESCSPRHLLRVGADGVTIEPVAGVPDAPAAGYAGLVERGASGLVLLSSGSTGAPKAILHDLDALVLEKLGKRPRTAGRPAPILMFLLFDHIGGINSLLGVLRLGGTAILPRQRTPEEICALIQEHRIRLLPTSPTFLNLILIAGFHQKYDLSSLRMISYGTEPMPEELLARVGAAFPAARLLQTFGTSETGISTTTSESSRSTFFRIEDPGVEHRIVDGELQLRSSTQFLGYLNYPSDSLTEDGWFRTGDLVEENADGYLKIKGRAKEVINVGGEKVLPLELESLLLASPMVADCTVYGRPNAITGQSVCVDVIPVGTPTRAELRKHVVAFLTGRVDPFKIPTKVNLVEAVTVSERFKKKRILP